MSGTRNAAKYPWLGVGLGLITLALFLGSWDALRPAALRSGSVRAAEGWEPERSDQPTVRLRSVPLVRFPGAGGPGDRAGESDSNSPAHWDGNTFYILSAAVESWRDSGPDLFRIQAAPRAVRFDRPIDGGRWIESTWKAEDGTLYGWYHNEPEGIVPRPGDEEPLTAPRIGAARSHDDGATWEDLGIVLEAPAGSLRRDTRNRYFAGGNGDFTVIPDLQRGYIYFLISTYYREIAEQGVSLARLRYADRDHPAGHVWKWRAGRWAEPGLGGRVTPVFPAARDWHGETPDAFWGPSIHWNTYLKQYVLLLNHAANSTWRQEGIYISFNRDLADPAGWTSPRKILGREANRLDLGRRLDWYPQVIGLNTEQHDTDKQAGRVARLFIHGRSGWEIVFLAEGAFGAAPGSRLQGPGTGPGTAASRSADIRAWSLEPGAWSLERSELRRSP